MRPAAKVRAHAGLAGLPRQKTTCPAQAKCLPREELSQLRAILDRFHFNFFTSTLEFLPLCSYFSRRAGGKSSGVPSAKPPLDWK
jgi:hypothetical protein